VTKTVVLTTISLEKAPRAPPRVPVSKVIMPPRVVKKLNHPILDQFDIITRKRGDELAGGAFITARDHIFLNLSNVT